MYIIYYIYIFMAQCLVVLRPPGWWAGLALPNPMAYH